MPKTLVLLLSDHPAVAARARRVADGARAVRFAEVDVRRAGDPPGVLTAADYDALVVGVAPGPGAEEVDAALRAFAGSHAMADAVGAAFAAGEHDGDGPSAADAACWAALRALAGLGLLLVPPMPVGAGGTGEDGDEAARRLGRRVATVAGWVRHARSHDHAPAHPHSHAHPPPH